MEKNILTAFEYQQCLLALPNVERGKYPSNRIRVAVVNQLGERKIEYVLKYPNDKSPTKFAEMNEVEFELCFEKTLPFWQPTEPITIVPIRPKEYQ